MKNIPINNNYISCQRCGLCCLTCCCNYGEEGEDGYCLFLRITGNIATCLLMEKQNKTPKDLGMTGGCILRKIPETFEFYKEMHKKRLLTAK